MIETHLDFDPRAPYNQKEPELVPCSDCEETGFLLLSKCCEVPVMQEYKFCPECGKPLDFMVCPGCDGEKKRPESVSDKFWKDYVK